MKSFGIIAIISLEIFSSPFIYSEGEVEALYGKPTMQMSYNITKVKPVGYTGEDWSMEAFYYIQTELSPCTLYYSETNYLSFFSRMEQYGLGAPTYVAYMSKNRERERVVPRGGQIDPADINENWILSWFSHSEGWEHWDAPCAIYLQRRPISIEFGKNGLTFRFTGPAGYVAFMPLYGYYKPPQEGKEMLDVFRLSPRKVETWKWADGVQKDALERVRYWSKVSREFPIYCEDTFCVDSTRDVLIIRQRFDWISIDDDWNTPHVKLAPISPPLAQVSMDKDFPVKFSGNVKDVGIFTPYGPYMGIEGVDSYEVELYVLKYVNETEAFEEPDINAHPAVKTALERLRSVAREKFRDPNKYEYDHGGLANFCWAIMGDQWYAKGLPYYDPETQKVAISSLRKYFHEDVLVEERFIEREYPKGSGLKYLILEGPGIGSWGVLGDAGKFSSNMLETLWCYAHWTGDWDLIKDRWQMIKKLFCTPAETHWVTFGREAIAEMGDESAPCLAFARMAYKVGDLDAYAYGCYMFARELVIHWLKQRGAQYFRINQPWHSMEFMDEEVYLTNFWGDTAGWQIDGPNYPEKTGERQYMNRWVRFKNEDVARFYRDFLKDDVKVELDMLTRRWGERSKYVNDSHIMPSLIQLRSLLLNETPEELSKLATPEKFSGPASGVIASCISVLRTSHPTRFVRLIPKDISTQFTIGLEREVPGPNPYLVQAVLSTIHEDDKARMIFPLITWWGWRTPSDFHRWVFGHVLPIESGEPTKIKNMPINWNTLIVAYALR